MKESIFRRRYLPQHYLRRLRILNVGYNLTTKKAFDQCNNNKCGVPFEKNEFLTFLVC
jgi:hypothetical protein